jgi:hypothetical protein
MSKRKTGKIGEDVQHITSEIKKYVENKVKLTILNIAEQLSKTIADSTGKIAAGFFLFIGFIFLLVALGLFVGHLLHNMVLGFLVASGPCLFAGLFIYMFAPTILARKMQNQIVEKVIKDIDLKSGSDVNSLKTDELTTN